MGPVAAGYPGQGRWPWNGSSSCRAQPGLGARLLNLLSAVPSAGRDRTWPQSGSSACSRRPGQISQQLLKIYWQPERGVVRRPGWLMGPSSCLPSAKEFKGSTTPGRLEGSRRWVQLIRSNLPGSRPWPSGASETGFGPLPDVTDRETGRRGK